MIGTTDLMLAFSQEITSALPLSSQAFWGSTTSGFTKTVLEEEAMLETIVLSKPNSDLSNECFCPFNMWINFSSENFLEVTVIQLIHLLGFWFSQSAYFSLSHKELASEYFFGSPLLISWILCRAFCKPHQDFHYHYCQNNMIKTHQDHYVKQ
jgi:hypothetical protein